MQQFLVATLVAISLGACAVSNDDVDPAMSEVESPSTIEIFRETWDGMVPGAVGGQNGWNGNCVVVGGGNQYLKCVGDRWAEKVIPHKGAGSFTLLADMGPNINVVNSTHGKLALEGWPGDGSTRAFQIYVGCDNIRVTFQNSGPTAVLATFPCQSVTGPPAFRVVCNWSTGGTVLSCGASQLPQDPTSFVNLVVPTIPPFDRIEIMTYPLPGASLFDKIYIWRN